MHLTDNEFTQLMKGLQGERLRQAFRYFDENQDGFCFAYSKLAWLRGLLNTTLFRCAPFPQLHTDQSSSSATSNGVPTFSSSCTTLHPPLSPCPAIFTIEQI
ncbi:hypothetical protein F5888DRAFT_1711207, partial [Russula emetica]